MSETGNNPTVVVPVSHGQSVDPSRPSIFSPQTDPFGKLAAPLVQQPLPEKK